MKATGIVRRIDDLGRVVIPKELRRTMHLREGAPLEIFTDKDGELIFKKYSPIGELGEFAADMCDSLRKAADLPVAVCDRDSVIAVAGAAKKELAGKSVSGELERIMERRALYRHAAAAPAVPACGDGEKYAEAIVTSEHDKDVIPKVPRKKGFTGEWIYEDSDDDNVIVTAVYTAK